MAIKGLGTENLSLQDEGNFFILFPVLSFNGHEPPWSFQEESKEAELQKLLAAGSEPIQEGLVTSTASDKELIGGSQEEDKEELEQPLKVVSELVQDRPVTSIASNKALTELEAECA